MKHITLSEIGTTQNEIKCPKCNKLKRLEQFISNRKRKGMNLINTVCHDCIEYAELHQYKTCS